MARYKIIYLLLLTYIVYVSAKEAEDRTITLKPPDKLLVQKSSPYQDQPSFFSRIKNWFFTQPDSVPADTNHHGGPQYLPPQPYQSQPECNPCNKAPWIPVAANVGHNTLINFVPPSSHFGGLKPPPQYGAPPPTLQYGQPPPSPQYGAPPPSPQYGAPPPSSQYGAPRPYDASITVDFRPPPPPPGASAPIFRPRPEKLHPIRHSRPTTHLRPVSDYAPLDMQPPPLEGHYHSLPTPPTRDYNQPPPPPPPPPSDSYGTPIVGPNADYLRPPEQLPLSSEPIPLPNLSPGPLAPIHNYQNFHQGFDSLPQQGENYEIKTNVQVLPSVKVADFLASIEHPINVIQSPLVELNVKNTEESYSKPKLSENPIVVEDTHTAASTVNVTIHQNNIETKESSYRAEADLTPSYTPDLTSNFIKELLNQEKNFTAPPMDYGNWEPSWNNPVPTIRPTTWLQPVTTNKPKQIQIIVPYVTGSGKMLPSKPYTTLVPVYTPPSTTEEVWSKFVDDFNSAESKKIAATAFTPPTTQVYNIRDLLKDTKEYPSEKLPFDVISLQNNIDDWTQQSFGKTRSESVHTPKKIPDNYFTTIVESTTLPFDHEQAGSNKKETKIKDDVETNLIPKETTTVPSWDTAHPTVLPLTREKLYIVTPQPYDSNNPTPKTAWSHPPKINVNNTVPTPKFVIRVDPEDQNKREKLKENVGPVTVVFSEWPHLINNLQTTTTSKTPTSKHPLLGLMDLSEYTPPPNSTVETIAGHSRVVTVVTPASVTQKSRNAK